MHILSDFKLAIVLASRWPPESKGRKRHRYGPHPNSTPPPLDSSTLPTSQEKTSLPGNDFIIFLLTNLNTLVGEPNKEWKWWMTPCVMQKKCGVWDLKSDGIPLMQKQNKLLSKTKSRNRGISELRCIKDLTGAHESKSALTSKSR